MASPRQILMPFWLFSLAMVMVGAFGGGAAAQDNANANAADLANKLRSAFGDDPAAMEQLRLQATYILRELDARSDLGASATTNASSAPAAPEAASGDVADATQDAMARVMEALRQLGGTANEPRVEATQSDEYYAPLGSGNNLLDFRERVQALKGYYADARTYLHKDDAVRIGGYINTLEGLGIEFISVFPLAELSFFSTSVGLATAITGLVGGILYTTASAVSLPPAIIALQDAVAAAEAAGFTVQGGKVLEAFQNRATGDIIDDPAALSSLMDSSGLADGVIDAATDVNAQLLPWVLAGGAAAPMQLATDVLLITNDSLARLAEWRPPVSAPFTSAFIQPAT